MRPAQMLLGLTVNDHWKVLEFASRPKDATGGKFSTGYIVENIDGRRGFLKAMDYVEALQHPDAPKMLEIMTTSYNFEKRVCEKCRDNYMKRVVHAIETGYIQADPAQPFSRVEYLIFDLADGDIRAHLDAQQAV